MQSHKISSIHYKAQNALPKSQKEAIALTKQCKSNYCSQSPNIKYYLVYRPLTASINLFLKNFFTTPRTEKLTKS